MCRGHNAGRGNGGGGGGEGCANEWGGSIINNRDESTRTTFTLIAGFGIGKACR